MMAVEPLPRMLMLVQPAVTLRMALLKAVVCCIRGLQYAILREEVLQMSAMVGGELRADFEAFALRRVSERARRDARYPCLVRTPKGRSALSSRSKSADTWDEDRERALKKIEAHVAWHCPSTLLRTVRRSNGTLEEDGS